MNKFKLVLFFTLVTLSKTSLSSALSYTCEVKHIYDLSNNGSLQSSYDEEKWIGSSFSVSRINGEIIGNIVPTVLANSTKVINEGSKDYSFKTVAFFDSVNKPFSEGNETSKYTSKVQLLEVYEFYDSVNKPFIAMSMSGPGLVTGICK